MPTSPRLLIISQDAIAGHMAGPPIRYWEWATALAGALAVTLAAPSVAEDAQPAGFDLVRYRNKSDLLALTQSADAVLVSGYLLRRYPFLRSLACPLIVDLSHSFVLESLQTLASHDHERQWDAFSDRWQVLNEMLLAGDFFVCNTERQRDYWLGMLSALGRVNPDTYAGDPALRHLIAVVPFGLPGSPPQKTRPVLKGVYKSIRTSDKVVYWGGGIYDWLDPLTLIRAAAHIGERRGDVKVFFAGVRHPNPHVTPMRMLDEALALSQSLGLTDRTVFFNDWVPYQERADYLLEADVGISLHLEHLETRYAFRTRALDYLWAGLPIICTEGDALADLVTRENLGRVVPYQDAQALAQALFDLLAQPDLRAELAPNFAHVAARYTWQVVTRPLAQFCQSPRLAPDRGRSVWTGTEAKMGNTGILWRERLSKGWRVLRRQGPLALWREVVSFWGWQWGR
jgi:glycosyltransferase involved in cell wall biosynthesis